jgi:carbonic anhydrase
MKFDESHPDALAVYCSDGRFTLAVDEHMQALGHERFDTVTVPGGPALLHMGGTTNIMHVDHMRSSTSFLVRGHGIKHVVLFAHEGCGWYKAQAAGALNAFYASIPEAQRSQILEARRWAQSQGVEDVKCFMARHAKGLVKFDEVVP